MTRRAFLLSCGGAAFAASSLPVAARIQSEGVQAVTTGSGVRVTVTQVYDRYPSAILHAPGGHWDLSTAERLTVAVTNTGSRKTTAMVYAFSHGGRGGVCSFPEHENGRHVLEPGQSERISISLQQRMPGGTATTIDPARIAYLRYIVAGGQPGDTLEFTHPELSGEAPTAQSSGERLIVPTVEERAKPAPGKRVRVLLPGFGNIAYILYLPRDWQPKKRYPVICEYPGNIFFFKDCHSTGLTDQGNIGYGLSKGEGYLWVNLPFVSPGRRGEQLDGCGDIQATSAYARQAVRAVCESWGGDPSAVILTGFSRGGLAASLVGLSDPATADIWLAMHAVQGGDGFGPNRYTRFNALQRARRLMGRPVFLTDTDAWVSVLAQAGQNVTSAASNMGAHTDVMFLDDRPSTVQAREWLASVVMKKPGTKAVFGRVLDGRGRPVEGARIESGFTHFTYTDRTGRYKLAGLTGRQRNIAVWRGSRPVSRRTVTLLSDLGGIDFRIV